MGYACPVCDHPQADARHLANHLAFTALARGGDHEAWLDDRVPEWESLDESALGDRVVDHAAETEFPQVFEDTTPDRESDPRLDAARSRAAEGAFEDDAADVLEEARELTRKRRENAADAGSGDEGENEDAPAESETE
jgi:hypothetical protein